MRVSLTTLTFDPLGAVLLDCLPSSSLGEVRRRMNRVATLDGGAAFNDFGYSEADRTIELRWRPSSAELESRVERLVRLYMRVRVATTSGCYVAALERYVPGATESRLTLLVVEKLTN